MKKENNNSFLINGYKLCICLSLCFFILCFWNNDVAYAKYTFNINENIVNLTRDKRIANYIIEYSEKDNYTNQDVKVTIIFDKEIEFLEEYTKIDDYRFEKVYCENTSHSLQFVDYSGNKSSLEVTIINIDKELPKIIGIENINNLKIPLKLDYTDNVGIRNVTIKKYSHDFNYRVLDDFYDDKTFYGIDVLDTKMKVTIIGRPVGTEKYKYYLNDVLKGITDNITFEFNNLTAMTEYNVKVEALDKDDNVIASRVKTVITQCFSNVEESKTSSLGVITFKGIYPVVKNIKLQVYSDENKNDVVYVDLPYDPSSRMLTFVFNRETFIHKDPKYGYKLHFYFYDASGREVSVLPYNLMFGVEANSYDLEVEDIYNINKKGIYQFIVEDISGNILTQYIEIN